MIVEKRIEELEVRLAFQEDTIQKLNDVVTGQQSRIDRLQIAIEHLKELMEHPPESFQPGDEKPPHY